MEEHYNDEYLLQFDNDTLFEQFVIGSHDSISEVDTLLSHTYEEKSAKQQGIDH